MMHVEYISYRTNFNSKVDLICIKDNVSIWIPRQSPVPIPKMMLKCWCYDSQIAVLTNLFPIHLFSISFQQAEKGVLGANGLKYISSTIAWACFHKVEVIYGLSIYYSVLFNDLVLSNFVSTKYVEQSAVLCFEEEGVLLIDFFLQTWFRCLTDWISIGF